MSGQFSIVWKCSRRRVSFPVLSLIKEPSAALIKKTAIRQYSQSEVSKNIVSKDAERVDVFEAVLLRLIARRTVM